MNNIEQFIENIANEKAVKKLAPLSLRFLWWALPAFGIVFALVLSYGLQAGSINTLLSPLFIFSIISSVVLATIALITMTPLAAEKEKPTLIVILSLLLLYAAFWAFELSSPEHHHPIEGHGLKCMSFMLVSGLLSGALALLILKRGRSTLPTVQLISMFASNSILAIAFIELHCAKESIPHLLSAHFLPAILCSIIGYKVGKKYLAW